MTAQKDDKRRHENAAGYLYAFKEPKRNKKPVFAQDRVKYLIIPSKKVTD